MTERIALAVEPLPLRVRVARLARPELFAAFGVLTVVFLFVDAAGRDVVGIDFRQFYVAAEAVVRGDDPYLTTGDPGTQWGGAYPYPPLPAFLVTPFTLLPFQAAGLLIMAVLVLCALAVPFVLGVRDWRCYGLLLVWPPVISAIQTGNVTLWFALAAAIAWRYRERPLPTAVSVGLTLATKFYLWPLVVWFCATRRFVAAMLSVATGLVLLLSSWAVIGFAGFTAYPGLLRQLEEAVGEDSYTAYIVGLDLGLPSPVARGLWLAIGLSLLALVVALARRGDERSAFVVAIAASLALTPIVWLHYFALLLVPVALAQPTLGLLWFVPLGMVLTPGSGHPTPFQTAWTLGVAALVIALALRTTLRDRAPRGTQAGPVVLGEA